MEKESLQMAACLIHRELITMEAHDGMSTIDTCDQSKLRSTTGSGANWVMWLAKCHLKAIYLQRRQSHPGPEHP